MVSNRTRGNAQAHINARGQGVAGADRAHDVEALDLKVGACGQVGDRGTQGVEVEARAGLFHSGCVRIHQQVQFGRHRRQPAAGAFPALRIHRGNLIDHAFRAKRQGVAEERIGKRRSVLLHVIPVNVEPGDGRIAGLPGQRGG